MELIYKILQETFNRYYFKFKVLCFITHVILSLLLIGYRVLVASMF